MTEGTMAIRKLATLLVAAAVAIATLPIMREAMANHVCVSFASIEAIAADRGDMIEHDFRGADAVAWVAAFNAEPPPSSVMADQVVIITEPITGPTTGGVPRALVLFLLADCVIADALPMLPIVNRITNSVLGGAS
jgi:hypothetical protein